MIGKIFGFNKKSDYYLEFDEAKGSDAAKSEPAPEKPAPAPAETQAKQPEHAPAPKPAKKTAKAADKPTSKKEAKQQAKATVESISVPQKEQPSEEAPFNGGLEATPEGMTFAPDYLMKQSSGGRRRPGPSLNMFKDMAREVGRR